MADGSNAQHIFISTAGLEVPPQQMVLFATRARAFTAEEHSRTFEFARTRQSNGTMGVFMSEDFWSGCLIQTLNDGWRVGPLPREILDQILLAAFPQNYKNFSHIALPPRPRDPTQRIELRPNWVWVG